MTEREQARKDHQERLTQAAAGMVTLATMLLRLAQDLESQVGRLARRPRRTPKRVRQA